MVVRRLLIAPAGPVAALVAVLTVAACGGDKKAPEVAPRSGDAVAGGGGATGGATAVDAGGATVAASPVDAAAAAPVATVRADPGTTALDLLTFGQGAIPLSLTIDGVAQDELDPALRIIDGNGTPFSMVRRGGNAGTVTEIVYELPAPTTLSRLAVPSIREVPSKATTFTRQIEVFGSATAADRDYQLLAAATLETHAARDQVSELALLRSPAVRWVKIRLVGGIDLPDGVATLQFSELIGEGQQDAPALVDHFSGIWKGAGGVLMELRQASAAVTGCYDSDGNPLTGTVSGNLLKAIGVGADDQVVSAFVLAVGADGGVRGVRSTNGAPFRMYQGPTAPAGTTTKCSKQPAPKLACGAVIHAINFDFDSATIRAGAEAVLQDLYAGLAADTAKAIVIEGHTSSEGSDAHNLDLSKRRAQAVVDELVRRGLARARISAAGRGEAEPIAGNDDETGRAMNRRVEVACR